MDFLHNEVGMKRIAYLILVACDGIIRAARWVAEENHLLYKLRTWAWLKRFG